jgi:N4-bis(aminopropyl)spermidine synthase
MASPSKGLWLSEDIDLRAALNAVSDVIQNRPRPLRDFDQIYMKAGDMVLQSEFIAHWANERRLAFVGDGDAIGICVAYLKARGILDYGPSEILVLDFDERIVGAVKRFADYERLEVLDAQLYNCLDPLPELERFDCFYTNPPWGASNGGESVNVFAQRGFELLHHQGEGVVVLADRDSRLEWTSDVLANVQAFAAQQGFYVARLMPKLHSYHLDDNPELRSCNLLLRSRSAEARPPAGLAITDPARLASFYGEGVDPTVRYVREQYRVDYGKAHPDEYHLELWEET